MIATPAGIEGLFRQAGRDRSTRQPGFEIFQEALTAAADAYGQVVVGPPRRPRQPWSLVVLA
ncbi:hypothetical protein [Nonomuraea sp. NPDC049784]|uniref:hypothetical protein n=1 Tax=Nonomuraea sp. NPDC049784 TaxID=3154361 RepID=UPI00340CA191